MLGRLRRSRVFRVSLGLAAVAVARNPEPRLPFWLLDCGEGRDVPELPGAPAAPESLPPTLDPPPATAP